MRHHIHLLVLVLLSISVGCDGGGESARSRPSTGLDAPERTLHAVPTRLFTIGGVEAPDWAVFGNVRDVRFDGSGNVYILDSQAMRVTVVSSSGDFLRTIGRAGEGPGELSLPLSLTVFPDGRVAIFDFGHRGYLLYDRHGRYEHTVTSDDLRLTMPGSRVHHHPSGALVTAGGRTIRVSSSGADVSEEGAPTRPVSWIPLHGDEDPRRLYAAWDLPETEGEDAAVSAAGGGSVRIRMSPERAFEPGLYTDVLPDGRIALVDSVGYRIKLLDIDGHVTETLERPVYPTPVTEALREKERERRLADLEEDGGPQMRVLRPGGGGGVVGQGAVTRMMTRRIENMTFAQLIPVIEDMRVDRRGRIWVERSSGEPGRAGPTDVITSDGRYLGTFPPDGLSIPEAFGPDGLMARTETDELDVSTVIVERLPEGWAETEPG